MTLIECVLSRGLATIPPPLRPGTAPPHHYDGTLFITINTRTRRAWRGGCDRREPKTEERSTQADCGGGHIGCGGAHMQTAGENTETAEEDTGRLRKRNRFLLVEGSFCAGTRAGMAHAHLPLRGLMQTVTRQVPPCFPRPLNSPTLRDSCKATRQILL
jgi:hypothetical protein